MNFTLNILGTASALPTVNRFPSAQVLDVRGRLFLIDAGEGMQIQMRRMHLSILKLDNIFISHTHGDHVYGIFGLLSTMSMLGRSNDLHIYAPASFSDYLDFISKTTALKFNAIHHVLKMDAPQTVYSTRTLDIEAFPLKHGVESYGFLFREKEPMLNVRKHCISKYGLTLAEIGSLKRGEDVVREDGEVIPVSEAAYRPYHPRSYAYCSDTAPFPELASWIKGVDVLYHESTFPTELSDLAAATWHSTAAQAARCAQEAGAGKLIIGHYSSRFPDVSIFLDEAKSVFPDTLLSKDGLTVEIPLIKNAISDN